MTNRTHPPLPSEAILDELTLAAIRVSGGSSDPLAPVTAMAPIPTEPGEIPAKIDEEQEIYALVMAGWTPHQIAHEWTLRTKTRWTSAMVDEAVGKVSHENLGRTSRQMAFAAQLELDRIESALKALWPEVQNGNLQAIDRFDKLSRSKREMLGLDAPDVRLQLTMGGQDALDLTALSNDELKMLQSLQRKAASAAKQKVVEAKIRG